ncbi:MAG: hypothetical protein HOP16_19505 [Acidobacteria bacterium]|nr:hypothetical protein [Acidobacteriota bacterium]
MASADLNAHPPDETLTIEDELAATRGSPSRPLPALVAVLDALGASVYSREEAQEFLDARSQILRLLKNVAADVFKMNPEDFSVFIFNDSIIMVYVRRQPLTGDDLNGFCGLLRSFEVQFLLKRILFRGAFSFGEVYRVEPGTNTVMGPAISDAAAWYERADWLGIHATPRTSIFIRQVDPDGLRHVLIDYAVPLKGKDKAKEEMNLKAINWPKGLMVAQNKDSKLAKAAIHAILGGIRSLPAGSESKYFHALEFFDHCAEATFAKQSQP